MIPIESSSYLPFQRQLLTYFDITWCSEKRIVVAVNSIAFNSLNLGHKLVYTWVNVDCLLLNLIHKNGSFSTSLTKEVFGIRVW